MSVKKLSMLLIGGVLLTVIGYAALIIGLTWPITELSVEKSGVFGDSFGLLTSLFSGLAFAGLIITIVMQKNELALQREELKLQRAALENQVAELKSMSMYAAIDHVRSMLDAALLRLSESGGEVTKPEQFLAAMMPGPEWKVLLESTNPDEVIRAFQQHVKKVGPLDQFLSGFSSTAKFYLRAVGNSHVNYTLNEYEFVVINGVWLKEVPHLSTHLQVVEQYAEHKVRYEPAHKMFMLAFLTATKKTAGNIVKDGAIEELVAYLAEHNKNLPAIARA